MNRAWLLPLLVLGAALSGADGTLALQIQDSDSGKPLYARVSARGSDGNWRWGKDLAGADLTYGGLPRAWSAGETEFNLPEGEAKVIVSRPFDYLPFVKTVTIEAGKTVRVAAPLKQLVNLRKEGWFGGDLHVHVVHGEKQFKINLPHAIPIARAEGQDWCSFGQVWTSLEDKQPTPGELQEICKRGSDAQFLAGWGMEHPKDHLGHMAAFPLGVAKTYLEAAGGNDYFAYSSRTALREGLTHFEILRALRGLGSLAIYSHPTREYGGTKESVGNIARELPFDTVAAPWCIEALDVFCDAPRHDNDEKLAYYLLNKGLRFAIVGLTDVCFDRKGERPGDTRTYVQLPPNSAPTFPEIVKAVRARKTFATTGPLVKFKIGERGIGGVLDAGDQTHAAAVEAWMAVDYNEPEKEVSIGRVEIIRNGAVWKTLQPGGAQRQFSTTFEVKETESAWYVAKVYGSDAKAHVAITSPIFFQTPGYAPPAPAPAAITGLVVDARTRAKVNGVARAVEYSVSGSTEIARAEIKDGVFKLSCPADCRVEISCAGYETQTKSLLLDVWAIYDEMFLPIRRKDLFDDQFYDRIRARLKSVELIVKLKPR